MSRCFRRAMARHLSAGVPLTSFGPLVAEIRRAARRLTRARGFTAPALFALAMGGGGGAALLALSSAGLAHPAPVEALAGVDVPGSRGNVTAAVRFTPLDRLLGAGLGLQDAAAPVEALQSTSLAQLLRTVTAVATLAILLASVNLLLLMLMRAAARRREVAVRLAMGASRRDLLRQLGTESAALALGGSVLALIVAAAAVSMLRAGWPLDLAPWLDGAVPVSAVALPLGALALAVGAAGAAATIGVDRRPLQPDLAAGDRVTPDPREMRLRRRLSAASVAGSVVLLVGAGVLLRGLSPATAGTGRGSDAADTLTIHVRGAAPAGRGDAAAEIETLLASLSGIPGVRAGAIASVGEWFGLGTRDLAHALLGPPTRAGAVLPPGTMRPATFHAVSPGYFSALEIPVLAGREFDPADRRGAPGVLVVNETFVRELLLGLDPVGKRVQLGGASLGGEFYTIVGVVPDRRVPGLGVPPTPQPAAYLPALQVPPPDLAVAVRTTGDPEALRPAVQAAIRSAIPAGDPLESMTMDARLERFGAPLAWFGRVFGAVALLSGLLAARGTHGVLAYSVRRRRREIGVRMAVGARPSQIVRMVVGESVRLTLVGASAGLAGALCLARLLEYLFLGVDALDPVVYGAVAVLLAVTALAASIGPALTAARLQPIATLREE